MNNIVKVIILMAFVGAVRATEISGVVKLSKNGNEYTQAGVVSVGRIDTYPKTEHPLYLKAYMDSLVSKRASKIANNGAYKVENIPQKKQLILIYDFGDLGSYFKKIAPIEKDKVEENNVIIIPTELYKVSIDFVKVKDRMIYIISSEKEGWVKFMSNSKAKQVVNLEKGKYEIVVISEGQGNNDLIQKMDIVLENKETNLKFTPKSK